MNGSGAGEMARIDRPSLGGLMKEAFRADGWRRERRRDIRPLMRLIPFVRAHLGDAGLGAAFLVLSTASLLAITGGARTVLDQGFGLNGEAALARVFLWLGAAAAALAATTGLRIYFLYKLGERVVADLRQAVFRHVLSLDPAHFLRLRTGEVLSRMTTDMTIVESTVGNVIPVALRNLLTLSGALALMIVVSPNVTGLVLVLIPLLLTPLLLIGRRMQRLSLRAQDRFAEAIGYAGEGLEALETVQAFGQEDHVSARFDASIESAFDASRAQIRVSGLTSGLMIGLIFAGMLILLFQCALAVIVERTMTPGALLQLLILAMVAASALKDLSETWSQIQKASGAAERIVGMIDATPTVAAPTRPTPMPIPPRGEIRFDQVRFAYPGRPDLPALNGFSLEVRRGERVALVGPSGGGKSTVFRLLLRFYDPDQGSVAIDGIDLRTACPREARARLALVAQDAPLFSGSAADNIAFGCSDANAEDVRAAARAAQADGFLAALPRGFDTLVGERAKTLSGGQRQRIAIARALVRGSPILLLDEATSALDAENERLVQHALHVAMEGRTTLVIAHRLATVLEADRIVVMDRGRVVEEGRHGDLLARGGLYARLARLQFGAAAA
ncbi:MAG: ABC transporter transmembrane domain-containing protein [Caulobacteraceae bacterium]